MANRCYLYASDVIPSEANKDSIRFQNLSEYNYMIPVIYQLLVSVETQSCDSSLWDSEVPIAVSGALQPGRERLFRFFEQLRAALKTSDVDSAEMVEKFEKEMQEITAFLSRPELDECNYFIMEPGEVYSLAGEDFAKQQAEELADILNIEPKVEAFLAEVGQKTIDYLDDDHFLGVLGCWWSDVLFFSHASSDADTSDTKAAKTAVILGGSGLIGSFLLPKLLESDHYDKVIALSRTPLQVEVDPKLESKLQNEAVDFEDVTNWPAFAADDVFCCLGTTQKIAGGQQPFYRVDHDYVVNACEKLVADGAKQLLVISAMGAKVGAKSFYMHTKGEMERDLCDLNAMRLHILRPSLLTGPRKMRRGEGRWNEEIGGFLMALTNPLMIGKAARSRSVPAEFVAESMLQKATQASQTAVDDEPGDEPRVQIHYPSAEYPRMKRSKQSQIV